MGCLVVVLVLAALFGAGAFLATVKVLAAAWIVTTVVGLLISCVAYAAVRRAR